MHEWMDGWKELVSGNSEWKARQARRLDNNVVAGYL